MAGSIRVTSMKRCIGACGEDMSEHETMMYNMYLETNVREYMNSLPATFEGNPYEPRVYNDDEDERVRMECAGHDREGLVGLVVAAEQRWRLSLYELLELELSLSDAAAESRYRGGQVNERDEDIEMLRLQLQVADEYNETLLREKAEALRKLTEAKKELALISTKAANLQRDLDAKTKWEKEWSNSLASTPRTMVIDLTRSNEAPDGVERSLKEIDPTGQLGKEMILRHVARMSEMSNHHHNNSNNSNNDSNNSNNNNNPLLMQNMPSMSRQSACQPVFATPVDRELRDCSFHDLSVVCVDPRRTRFLSARDDPLREAGSTVVLLAAPVDARSPREAWRLPVPGPQWRNAAAEREPPVPHDCCGSALSSVAVAADDPQLLHFAHRLQSRRRRAKTELERLARELAVERERTRVQHRLETKLLHGIGQLAQRLRARENNERALRAQFRKDTSLTHEELLNELQQCRQSLSDMIVRHEESLPTTEGGSENEKTQWALMEELAAALEQALTANEGLRLEKECILTEKKMQEVSYEVELRSRVVEMEELTTVLHELREQVSQLRPQRAYRRSIAPKSSLAQESQYPTQDLSNAGMTLTSRENAVSEFLNSGLPIAGANSHYESHNRMSLPNMPHDSLHVFNETR